LKSVNASGHFHAGAEPVYPPALDTLNVQYVTTESPNKGYLHRLWDQIQLTAKEEDVVKLLQVIDARVERVAFRASEPEALVKLKEAAPLPLGNLGDGMTRLLTIAIALVSASNGYLLVDEIDTGLHYRTITDMWRVVMETAVRLNVQVFATTHSWDCQRSFAEALNMQDDQDIGAFFRLQRRGEQIEAIRYDAERLTFAIEQDIEVR
jgi:ABC-type multidrug transport system ATPase subunit